LTAGQSESSINGMSLAADAPHAFALRHLDDRQSCSSAGASRDATAAALKAIKLRKADRQVREVVGIDAAGHPCRIELGSTQATRENSTGYRIVGRIGAKTSK
jgi:hypothetical protein